MDQRDQKGAEGAARAITPGLVAVLGAATVLVGAGFGMAFQDWSSERTAANSAAHSLFQAGGKVGKGVGKGAGPGARFRAQFNTATMFPAFRPDQRRYVTRCGPSGVVVRVNAFDGALVRVQGSRPATGRFKAEARPVAGQDFRIVVSGASSALDGSYSVRCLPIGFPRWSYRQFRKPPKGIFTVAFRPKPAERHRSWIIAFDQDGLPRWWMSPDLNALWAEVLPDRRVIWGRGFGDGFGQDDRAGIEVTDLSGRPGRLVKTVGTPNDSHEYVALDNGNSLVMSYRPRYGVDLSRYGLGKSEGVLDGEIQEVNPEGRVVWRWNSGRHIGLDETPDRWWEKVSNNPHEDPADRDRYDVFHLNSIQPIPGDQLLISTRHTDAVFAISRRTGEVVWKLGGTKTPKSLRVTGPDPHADDPLSGNHDARLENGILSVHDNGTRADRPPRLVRYRIDPEAGTATFAGQIEGPADFPYSHCCGGARRFGTGWIVSWGNSKTVAGYDRAGRLAFRLALPVPSYRAVPVPASVPASVLDRALDANEVAPGPPGRAIGPVVRVPAGGGAG